MSGINLETAQSHLDAWLEAELAVINGQLYKIGTRELKRADLNYIRQEIDYWNNMVAKLSNIANKKGRNRVIRVIPRDL